MDRELDGPHPLPPVVAAFGRKGQPLVAWIVIVAAVTAIVGVRFTGLLKNDAAAVANLRHATMTTRMQARYLVGAADLISASRADLLKQARALNTGPVEQRLDFLILVGELDGPQQALEHLDELDRLLTANQVNLSAEQKKLRDILRALYTEYAAGRMAAPTVNKEERDLLDDRLGWFGALALNPAGGPDPVAREAVLAPARRTAVALFVATFAFIGSALVGGVGLVVLATLLTWGWLRCYLQAGSVAGGLFAETFAVWMLLFVALSVGASLIPAGGYRFLILAVAMFLSLTALAWPVWRGLSWRQVRREAGLSIGERPFVEPFLGIGTYVMAMPLLAIGLGLTLFLLRLQGGMKGSVDDFAPVDLPSHPAVEPLTRLDWWGRLQLFLVASVAAPIVEETMFRGVLYRHLRDASVRFAWPMSVLLSSTVASFIFAVIHPQGLATVPVLMALAYAFSLAREWRGTLIPAMVAHALNNGAVMTLVLMIA